MESRKIRYQLDRLPMVLFIACLAITVVAGKLKPVYDGQKETKLFRIGKPLSLMCTPDSTSDADKVVWSKKVESEDKKDVFKNVKDISSLKGRYQTFPKEGKFIIEKALDTDAGDYTCSLGEESYPFDVYAAIAVKVPENLYTVEDEKLEINCVVKGTEPNIRWEFLPEKRNESVTPMKVEESDRFLMEEFDSVDNAKLVIKEPKMEDRGTYTCIGSNKLMEEKDYAKSESFVRVKDKLAAVWPFVGIVAEVFILCTIILIYEKRRNKTDLDESDTDQSPDQKNDHNKDSDVRHRK